MEHMRVETSDDEDEDTKNMKKIKNKADKLPRAKSKKIRINVPSLLELSCNSVELIRLRGLLVDLLL